MKYLTAYEPKCISLCYSMRYVGHDALLYRTLYSIFLNFCAIASEMSKREKILRRLAQKLVHSTLFVSSLLLLQVGPSTLFIENSLQHRQLGSHIYFFFCFHFLVSCCSHVFLHRHPATNRNTRTFSTFFH